MYVVSFILAKNGPIFSIYGEDSSRKEGISKSEIHGTGCHRS